MYSPLLTVRATSMQHDIPFLTVVSSMKRLMRYSLGSVALGSLVVSVVEWVRFILECLRRKLKFVSSARESCFGKAASSSSECCLGCIDWTLKSVNRNAYIMVSIKVSYRSNIPLPELSCIQPIILLILWHKHTALWTLASNWDWFSPFTA